MCVSKIKECDQILCWCDQLRKLVASLQPLEKLDWSPVQAAGVTAGLYYRARLQRLQRCLCFTQALSI